MKCYPFLFHEKSNITSEERMRHLEELEKRSEKSSFQQTEVMERFSKFLHLDLSNYIWLLRFHLVIKYF